MVDEPKLVSIELDGCTSPIAGRLRSEAEPIQTFVGWIGLLSALERAINPSASETDDRNNSALRGQQLALRPAPRTDKRGT